MNTEDCYLENAVADLQTSGYFFDDGCSVDGAKTEWSEALTGVPNATEKGEGEEVKREGVDVSSAILDALFNDIQPVDPDMLFGNNPQRQGFDFSGHADMAALGSLEPSMVLPEEGSLAGETVRRFGSGAISAPTLRCSQSLNMPPPLATSLNPTLLDSFSHEPDLARSLATPNSVRSVEVTGLEVPDTRYELSARNENGSPDIFAADSFCVLGPSSMDSSSSCGKEPVERKAWRRKGTSSGLSEKQLQELQDVDPKKARRIISNRASAARSKERKFMHIHDLERRVEEHRRRGRELKNRLEECHQRNIALEVDCSRTKQYVWTIRGKIQKASAAHQALERKVSKARSQTLKNSCSVELSQAPGHCTSTNFGSANSTTPVLPRYSDMLRQNTNDFTPPHNAASTASWNLAADQDWQASGRSKLFGFGAETAVSTVESGSRGQSVPSILDINAADMDWELSDDNWMQLGLVDSSHL